MNPALSRQLSPLLRFAAWGVACFLLLPILVVVPISLTPERYLSFPTSELSLRHYARLVTDQQWAMSIGDSLIVATGATLVAVVLGSGFAIAAWRLGSSLTQWLRVLMLAPMIVPPIVHAVAFYRAWAALGLLDTYAGLILIHAMKGIPFVVLSTAAVLVNLDNRLEQAARSLGATPSQAVRWVVLPQLVPGIVAGGLFAFVTSWDEIVVALFVTSRKVYTLPRRIWDGLADNIDPAIAALGTVLVAVTLVIVAFKELRRRSANAALS